MEALSWATPPTTCKELQSFLGLANYYQCFVPHFASTVSALTDQLKGGGKRSKPVILMPEALQAFHNIKDALCHQMVLHTPLSNQPFLFHMDASSTGLGTILAQDTPQGEWPIIFLSHKLSPTEYKYAVIKKEVLEIRWSVDQLKYYLWGQDFMVVTDHDRLQWLSRMKDTNPRLMHWYLALQPYRFSIRYRRGCDHANADVFSSQSVWASLEQQAYLAGCVWEPRGTYPSPPPPP